MSDNESSSINSTGQPLTESERISQLEKENKELRHRYQEQQSQAGREVDLEKKIQELVDLRLKEERQRRIELISQAKQQVQEAEENAEWERLSQERDRYKTREEGIAYREAEFVKAVERLMWQVDNYHYPQNFFMSNNNSRAAQLTRKLCFASKFIGPQKLLEMVKRNALKENEPGSSSSWEPR